MKNKIKKIMSIIVLSSITLNLNFVNRQVSVYAIKNKNLNYNQKTKKESFLKKYPVLAKAIKYLILTAKIISVILITHYAGRFVLDKIYPQRLIDREDRNKIKIELSEMESELNKELSKKFNEIDLNKVKELRELKVAIKETLSSESSLSFGNIILGISCIGGILGLLDSTIKFINNLGESSKGVLNISCLRYAGGNFVNMFHETSDLFKAPPKEFTKDEILHNFENVFKDFYGQKKAILDLKSHLYDIIIAKDQAKWQNKKYSRCDIIYLYGPSGVGKSFMASKISKVLLQSGEILTISASDVDKEKKESVVDQLFNSNSNHPEHQGRISLQKPLPKYLKNNKNGIVIFEEYDKAYTSALDEVFRTLSDRGKVKIDGEIYDCSGTTFIFTSNEISLKSNINKNSKLTEKEISEGYTEGDHSESFLNRIKKVKFEKLNINEYCQIIKKHFDEIANYWHDQKNAGITLTINNKIINKLAESVEEINRGARPIDFWIIASIQAELGNKIKSAPNLDFYRNKKFDIKYNSKTKKIKIKKI
ncbi:MAG: AAA family ATPase [Elusimicrobiota bacterium]|nr:AAA family ATPase [Elusimicrobiota bacterium]